MEFATGNILKDINFGLALLTTSIKLDTHINLTDKAKIAENIFGDIFTVIFRTSFKSADSKLLNHPSIDLISEEVVFQVSTDATHDKIRKTTQKFIEKDYHNKYKKLRFLFISSRNPLSTSKKLDFGRLPIDIFNPSKDILYSDRLSSLIQGLEDAELKQIKKILWVELGLDYDRKRFKWIYQLESILKTTTKERTSNLEFDKDLLFYTEKEQIEIDDFIEHINFDNRNSFLITGYPSTGKTTTAFHIAKKIKNDLDKGYFPFYVKIQANDQVKFSDFYDDLERIGNNPAIIVIDDVHLNFELANELLSRSEDYINIIFLFVSRYISEDLRKNLHAETEDIFEELKDFTLSFEKFNSDEFYKEKLSGIINKYQSYVGANGQKLRIGNPLKVFELTNKNLFKLRLILKEWEQSKNTLSEIDDTILNKLLYSRFLQGLSNDEQEKLMVYSCLYVFEISFLAIENDRLLSEKDGLFFKEEYESLFMHSSFSDLLIDAYIFHNKYQFKQKYNENKDVFILENLKTYIRLHTSNEHVDYPDNIYSIFYNVGINRRQWIFNELLKYTKSRKSLVNYFKLSDNASSEELKNILQSAKLLAKRSYEELVNQLIIENNSRVDVLKRGTNNLLTLSYVHYSIHPNNKYLRKELYRIFSDSELLDIISKAQISKITLALKYIQDKQIRHRLTNLITKDRWVEIFNNVPFKFLGNSLTELKTIDSELAFYIYNKIDVKYIADRFGKIRFDNFTKSLSEINILGNKKATFLLRNIDISKVQASFHFASITQIGIGFSRIKKIDESYLSNLLDGVDGMLLYKKLITSDLNDFGRVLVEIHNVSNKLSSEILANIKLNNPFGEKFNSTKIKGKEISHLLESLHKVGDKHYGLHIIENAHPDIIYGRILSSSVPISSHIIKSINYYNKELAKKYLTKYLKTNISEKLNNRNIFLTHLPNIFEGFRVVDRTATNEFYSNLDNYLFVKKALSRDVKLAGLANAFNVLQQYDRYKTKNIIENLNSHNVFHKKVAESKIESFLSSLSILHKLCPSISPTMINTFKSKLEIKTKTSIQFSQFCDALYRVSKVDEDLAKNILQDFKQILSDSYKNIGFRKLSSGLNTLGKMDIVYAKTLLNDIPMNDLKNRIDDIINNEHNINGALGEIKNVDKKIWNELYRYAAQKSSTMAGHTG